MNRKNEKPKFTNLRLRSNKSNVICSPHTNEKISSYFPKISQESSSQLEMVADEDLPEETILDKSLLKYVQTSTLDTSASDFNCFKSIKKKPVKQVKLFAYDTTKVKKRKTKTESSTLVSESNDICSGSDVNLEHLQLALALSNSLQPESSVEFANTQQKADAIKNTLEQFGFKSDVPITRSTIVKPVPLRRKKKKILKTVLMSRTEDDRKHIIEDKVSQILANINQYNEHVAKYCQTPEREHTDHKPGSFTLRELYDEETTLFKKCALESLQDVSYYGNLVNPDDAVRVGCLLRDWRRIPGREETPERTICPRPEKKIASCPKKSSPSCDKTSPSSCDGSVSPDLFSEDDCIQNPLDNVKNKQNINMFSNRNNNSATSEINNSGDIFHFESFNDAVCFDLTHSSDSTHLSSSPQNTIRTCEESVDLTQSSDDSIRHDSNDASLDVSKAIDLINEPDKKCDNIVDELSITQILDSSKEASVDLIQSHDDKRIILNETTTKLFDDKQQFINNDSKITNLIREAVSSQDCKSLNISENCDVTDLICDVLLSGSACSETELANDDDCKSNDSLDHDSYKNDKISIKSPLISSQLDTSCYSNVVIERAEKLNITCISSDSEEELQELNCSITSKKLSVSDEYLDNVNINSSRDNLDSTKDSTGKHSPIDDIQEIYDSDESSVMKNEMNIIKQPHIFDLSSINSDKTKQSMFNASLEKILEENDPWATDVIEFNSRMSCNGPVATKLSITCISSDSEEELNDDELNYSSYQSKGRASIISKQLDHSLPPEDIANVADDNIRKKFPIQVKQDNYNSDMEQSYNSVESASKKNRISIIKHPRIADLCAEKSTKRKSQPIFNESLEKILEENDPWANDVIEFHSEVPYETFNHLPTTVAEKPTCSTPEQQGRLELAITPDAEFIIKTTDVTPMVNYREMDTPQRNKELDKYGIKPLKRAKSVKILEYIYDATHPVSNVEKNHKSPSSDEDDRLSKRRKTNKKEKYISNSQVRKRRSQLPVIGDPSCGNALTSAEVKIVGDLLADNDSQEDLIFERKISTRISSCRIPLHIVWYNYVTSQPDLLENILLYEPLQLEEIYAQFKNLGFKFHIQDLTTFLDKKCITIRTGQNNRTRKNAASQR